MRMLGKACGVLAMGLALCAAAHAQTPDRDPRALAALQQMGSYLRSLEAFRITGPSATEYVMDDGQKYRVDGQVDYLAKLPGQLHAKITNPGQARELFLDGKTLTVYAPGLKYYASGPLQGDLQSLLVDVQDQYGVQLPLADLFWFGTAQAPAEGVLAATVVGPARIGGAPTTQYAFRQKGVDWQVWIEDGERPLPRRFVITDTTDPARPQYTADLQWDLKPRISSADFTFSPGKDDHPIKLVAATAAEVQP